MSEEENPAAGHRARLRDRFEKTGLAGFAEYEVLELVLMLCIPRRDVKPLAKALVARFGNVRAVFEASREDLLAVPGVGEVTPINLRLIREVAVYILQQQAEQKGPLLNSTSVLEEFWRARLSGLTDREVFEVAYLDNGYRLLPRGVERLEEGVVTHAHVYPRKVMERALRRGAVMVVVAHNHPSGKVQASKEDVDLTNTLVRAGNSLGIKVIDHMIVAGNTVFSFKREGLL